MLKFYSKHARVVDKDHEIISFRQSNWLEEYINIDTQKRKKAVNDFEKDFSKLLKEAFSGKTLQNVRDRIKLEFVER